MASFSQQNQSKTYVKNANILRTLEIKVLSTFNKKPYEFVSSFDLENEHNIIVNNCLSNLAAMGAIFEREIRPGRDNAGIWHPKVCYYRFRGWSLDVQFRF